jgi:hypothetical protein
LEQFSQVHPLHAQTHAQTRQSTRPSTSHVTGRIARPTSNSGYPIGYPTGYPTGYQTGYPTSHLPIPPQENVLTDIRLAHFGKIIQTWMTGDLARMFAEDERKSIFHGALHVYNRYIYKLAAVDSKQQNYLCLALACIWLSSKYLSMVDKRICVQMVAPFDDPSHKLLQKVVQFESRVANDPRFSLPLFY